MANTLAYPSGGGMFWAYANWAFGLKSLGRRVIWMEGIDPEQPACIWDEHLRILRERLAALGLGEIALCSWTEAEIAAEELGCLSADVAARESELLLNLAYGIPESVCGLFQKTALIDIDPGQLQRWLDKGEINLAKHDFYFSIGEGVGRSAEIPTAGRVWQHTRPCVSLDHWPLQSAEPSRGFTTISHWYADERFEHRGEWIMNDKRTAYEPYLNLPQQTHRPMELAICLAQNDRWERDRLTDHGWSVRDAGDVAATPVDYQRYIQGSLAEFGCAKPSYVIQQTSWVSDRTVCYLASGRPAVVQDTGPSDYLPRREGLFRFSGAAEAADCLRRVCEDYPRQSRCARRLAEECFDARKVVAHVLDRCLN